MAENPVQLAERACRQTRYLSRSLTTAPPLVLYSFAFCAHRRPALSVGKRSILRESFTPNDLGIANEVAEAEAETDTHPQEEDQASFFKSYLESRNGT
jgi:hypothetical protein